MAATLSPSITEETLQGFKYFRVLGPLFAHLRTSGLERDRAGNRQLFYDQYASLLLLYFFNPVVTSLRGLQQTTTLANVQARLGVRRTSLGALSEAAYVFDAALLHEVLTTLGPHLRPHLPLAEQAALAQLTAVDGSLLPALPRMAWALWQDDQHRAAKMHMAFAVLRQGPVDVTVTAGNRSERAEWRRLVQPGGFYVVDRGYADYSLFQELHDLPCSFLCRVQDNAVYEVQASRSLAPTAVQAGVVYDAVLRRLGTAHHTRLLPQPFRVVRVATGKTRKDGTPDVLGPGHESAGPGRRVDRRGVSLSVGSGAVFPVGQMCVGLPAFAEPGDQRGAYPGLCGLYCKSVDQPVGRTSTDQADVRDALFLSQWMGHGS